MKDPTSKFYVFHGFSVEVPSNWDTRPEVPSGNLLHSYWKWPLIVDFPIKHGDFHSYVSLPEGMPLSKMFLFFPRTWIMAISMSTSEDCPGRIFCPDTCPDRCAYLNGFAYVDYFRMKPSIRGNDVFPNASKDVSTLDDPRLENEPWNSGFFGNEWMILVWNDVGSWMILGHELMMHWEWYCGWKNSCISW